MPEPAIDYLDNLFTGLQAEDPERYVGTSCVARLRRLRDAYRALLRSNRCIECIIFRQRYLRKFFGCSEPRNARLFMLALTMTLLHCVLDLEHRLQRVYANQPRVA